MPRLRLLIRNAYENRVIHEIRCSNENRQNDEIRVTYENRVTDEIRSGEREPSQ